jgi:hypothetical protein
MAIIGTTAIAARLRARGVWAPPYLIRRVLDAHFPEAITRIGLARGVDESLLPAIESRCLQHRQRDLATAS